MILISAALMMGRTKRVGGNIGPKARQPLPGALHKKRREWGRERQGISRIGFSTKNMNQDRFAKSLSTEKGRQGIDCIRSGFWYFVQI